MKIINMLFSIMLFVPAIIGIFFIVVLYSPNIPITLVFTLLFLWCGSGLLALNKAIGAISGIMSPILLLIIMQDEFMHVNPTVYTILYMVFYAVCGLIVFKRNKRNY